MENNDTGGGMVRMPVAFSRMLAVDQAKRMAEESLRLRSVPLADLFWKERVNGVFILGFQILEQIIIFALVTPRQTGVEWMVYGGGGHDIVNTVGETVPGVLDNGYVELPTETPTDASQTPVRAAETVSATTVDSPVWLTVDPQTLSGDALAQMYLTSEGWQPERFVISFDPGCAPVVGWHLRKGSDFTDAYIVPGSNRDDLTAEETTLMWKRALSRDAELNPLSPASLKLCLELASHQSLDFSVIPSHECVECRHTVGEKRNLLSRAFPTDVTVPIGASMSYSENLLVILQTALLRALLRLKQIDAHVAAALLERNAIHQPEKSLFVIGNDALNGDNRQGTTTDHKGVEVMQDTLIAAIERMRLSAPDGCRRGE